MAKHFSLGLLFSETEHSQHEHKLIETKIWSWRPDSAALLFNPLQQDVHRDTGTSFSCPTDNTISLSNDVSTWPQWFFPQPSSSCSVYTAVWEYAETDLTWIQPPWALVREHFGFRPNEKWEPINTTLYIMLRLCKIEEKLRSSNTNITSCC